MTEYIITLLDVGNVSYDSTKPKDFCISDPVSPANWKESVEEVDGESEDLGVGGVGQSCVGAHREHPVSHHKPGQS